MIRPRLLLAALSACASSSTPIVAELGDTHLVTLPSSAYPDDAGETRITRLVARGDHALVVGMGACIGKAIDRCLAGAPLWIRGSDAPRQIDELRRPTSLLWTDLTEDGDVVAHRLPEGDEPSLSRFDETSNRLLDYAVDSNPGLLRAVDGSVLAQVRDGEQYAIVRIGAEGEEEIARGGYFGIETHDDLTYVQAYAEGANALVTIGSDGEVRRVIEDATAIHPLVAGQLRLHCAESDGSELVEASSGVRVPIRGTCSARLAASGVVWNDSEVWAWGDTPVRLASEFVGDPRVERLSTGWVLLDDTSIRWIDFEGVELRREALEARGTLHVSDDHIAVWWNDDLDERAHVRTFDGEGSEVVLAEGAYAMSTMLTPEGILWVTASRGGDDYLRGPATELYRVDGSEVTQVLEGASALVLYRSLLGVDGALYALGADMEHVVDVEGTPREIAPGVYEYTTGGQYALIRWEGELVELARSNERFDLRGSSLRWRSGDSWSLGHLVEDELVVGLEGLDTAEWLNNEIATVTREGRAEACHVQASGESQCWTIPDAMSLMEAQVTDTGRFFALLRSGDENVLWYSTR